MVEIKRMMETAESGVQYQYYPLVHADGVVGLDKLLKGQGKVNSVNGFVGDVILTPSDLGLPNDLVLISKDEYQKLKQIIADYEAGKLGGSGVEFEKVEGDGE
ncbi:hypothetical protein ACOMOA_000114 [Enterococcus faecalis]|uniref:hypothetical protein n=1 Tax=Bacteria TaxID=2 RepID=UPI0001E19C0A|nr:hypothetical protein [Enterococcus faecalis]MCD0886274.1 hypothetical protein [Staphylococcus aureus]EFM71614.1 hypothetical protein HMPREF9505_00106 [Enterococcus faecalis TX0109]EGO2744914.1 hypothetical protein [Enterococcus faecalis]EGO7585946.1 hypothetical protein [Enterococcus faecalis]EGO8007310.1 hypothetical protein [Enterococcus faecalis]